MVYVAALEGAELLRSQVSSLRFLGTQRAFGAGSMFGSGMFGNWRVSTFNGALLAFYFIPSWAIAALKIWIEPIRGLYDRANIAPTMYISDLNLPPITSVRFAWLLALGKFTVVAFFFVFLLLVIRDSIRKKESCNEALTFALGLGAFISTLSMLAASHVEEWAALQLHSSESLLLLGAWIVLIIDSQPVTASLSSDAITHLPEQIYLSGNPRS